MSLGSCPAPRRSRAAVDPDESTIVYRRLGGRSSHTWFEARSHDGSWIEWGSVVGMPVAVGEERGDPAALEVPAPPSGDRRPVDPGRRSRRTPSCYSASSCGTMSLTEGIGSDSR